MSRLVCAFVIRMQQSHVFSSRGRQMKKQNKTTKKTPQQHILPFAIDKAFATSGPVDREYETLCTCAY